MSMILASLGPTPQRQTVDVPALNKQRLQLGFCGRARVVSTALKVGWVEENAGQVLLWLDDPVSEETLVVPTHSHDVPHTGGRLADAIWEVCRKAILHGSYKRLVRKLGD